MDCFPDSGGGKECHKNEECAEQRKEPLAHFCCCATDMCNSKFRWAPHPDEPTTPRPTTPGPNTDTLPGVQVAIYCLVAILVAVIAAGTFLVIWCYRRKKGARDGERGENGCEDGTGLSLMEGPQSQEFAKIDVELEKVVARGRFGAVWKGRKLPREAENDQPQMVAVKIFQQSEQDRNSWKVEYDIFKLPRMEHENILQFIGVKINEVELNQKEYWLMTTFHDRGE